MYILTVHGKENEGAYSVEDDDGDQILYLFQALHQNILAQHYDPQQHLQNHQIFQQ